MGNIADSQSGAGAPPMKAGPSEARVGNWPRWLLAWDLEAFFRCNMTGFQHLRHNLVYPLIAGAVLSATIFYATRRFDVVGILIGFAGGAAPYQKTIIEIMVALIAVLAALKISFAAASALNRYRLSGVTTGHYQFNVQEAGIIAEKAASLLKDRLPSRAADAIERLRKECDAGVDRAPYLVLRALSPVALTFPVRPRMIKPRNLPKSAEKKIRDAKRNIDAVAGGVLWLLDAAPGARFQDDRNVDKIVQDKYTDKTVQEMPDNYQTDIFLRFHQSTVERSLPDAQKRRGRTCRYKTYSAISNLRRTPIYIIAVRDVIDCLEQKSADYTEEEYKKIFQHTNELNKDNIVEFLSQSYYVGVSPRAERYMKDVEGVARPILRRYDNGDSIMSFDAARVWRNEGGDDRHTKAIIALRRAIDLVSRKKAAEVVLTSRDILVVDNLRAMVARREDDPLISWRDVGVTVLCAAPFSPDFSGWWLRLIYGYPRDGDIADYDDEASMSGGVPEEAEKTLPQKQESAAISSQTG